MKPTHATALALVLAWFLGTVAIVNTQGGGSDWLKLWLIAPVGVPLLLVAVMGALAWAARRLGL